MVKRKGLVIFWICVFVGLAAILITVRSLRSTAKNRAIEPDEIDLCGREVGHFGPCNGYPRADCPIAEVAIPKTVEPSIPTQSAHSTEAKHKVKKPHHEPEHKPEHKHGAKVK
jgi:hypothetical protein